MSSAPPPAAPSEAPARPLNVALIGNPNTGKSTLFNALAGLQARVGNFPGVTVEKKVGRVNWEGRAIHLIDLPGTYSLAPRSRDEMVSVDVLLGRQADVGPIDAVVCILDSSNIERNSYLLCQLLELELPVVVVLNMSDLLLERGMTLKVEELQQRLGAPVVQCEAHRRRGLEELRAAILQVTSDGTAPARPRPFPEVFYEECERLQAELIKLGEKDVPACLVERLLIDSGGHIETFFAHRHQQGLPAVLTAARERLAAAGHRIPAVEAKSRYDWVRRTLDGVITRPQERPETAGDRLDQVLTHRVGGLVIFSAIMLLVFMTIYAWAEPFMGAIEAGQEFIAGLITARMAPGPLRSLLTDGIIAGVGGVVVFLPQIAFLFLFIALLEDCGYMARAAFLMDRLMTRLGLSGKSFVPLMSSFACAIPGVMATRTIENHRDRMVTMLVAPLMSCSARLPVYVLLIALFIPENDPVRRGLVLFAMYSLGVLIAAPVAWILRKTFFKGETPPFVMELPSYKLPSPRIVFDRVYDRSRAFLVRAGTLIFATSVLVWAAGYFPGDHTEHHELQARMEALEPQAEEDEAAAAELEELAEREHHVSASLLETSLLGRAGHAIEPVVRPLGWDWRIGVGAIASFPAREVIVATLGTIYSLGGDVDEENEGLRSAMKSSTRADGTPVYTMPVCLSVMVFFALCAQCAATLMVIRRESNSWLWPVFTFVYMTGLAWLGALVTYQIGMQFV